MKKIKIDRCSCACGGRWAYFVVEPHGAEISVGCVCHTELSNNGPEWTEIELVNSTGELLEILRTVLWDFRLKQRRTPTSYMMNRSTVACREWPAILGARVMHLKHLESR